MMMHHPIKFGCKRISSSVDMVDTVMSDYMSPQCDPDLEDSKPIFMHGTLAHDVNHQSKFVYKRFSSPGDTYTVQMIIHWNFEPFL